MTRMKNAVLSTAIELMEQDMQHLCGKPFARKLDENLCHRGGSEMTSWRKGADENIYQHIERN